MKKKGLVVACIIAVVVGAILGHLFANWVYYNKDTIIGSVDNAVESVSEIVYSTTDKIFDNEKGITYNKNTREIKVKF